MYMGRWAPAFRKNVLPEFSMFAVSQVGKVAGHTHTGGQKTSQGLWGWQIRIRNGGKRTDPHKPMGNVRRKIQGDAPVQARKIVGTCFDPEDGDAETLVPFTKHYDDLSRRAVVFTLRALKT